MSQILHCDWLPERARWTYLVLSGLPVARPLGNKSLISSNNAIFSSIFSLSEGKCLLKCSVNFQHLPKGKEREWNHPGVVKILFQLNRLVALGLVSLS